MSPESVNKGKEKMEKMDELQTALDNESLHSLLSRSCHMRQLVAATGLVGHIRFYAI